MRTDEPTRPAAPSTRRKAPASADTGAPLRALTLRQPWASAVVNLGKDVENRTWRTHLTGLVLIHAAAHLAAHLREMPEVLRPPTRAVVGVVRITGAHTCDGSCSPWAEPGVWHWTLADAVPLTAPVPASGKQGLWIPDDGLRRRVARALAGHAADRLGPLLASDLIPSPERTS